MIRSLVAAPAGSTTAARRRRAISSPQRSRVNPANTAPLSSAYAAAPIGSRVELQGCARPRQGMRVGWGGGGGGGRATQGHGWRVRGGRQETKGDMGAEVLGPHERGRAVRHWLMVQAGRLRADMGGSLREAGGQVGAQTSAGDCSRCAWQDSPPCCTRNSCSQHDAPHEAHAAPQRGQHGLGHPGVGEDGEGAVAHLGRKEGGCGGGMLVKCVGGWPSSERKNAAAMCWTMHPWQQRRQRVGVTPPAPSSTAVK